MSAQTVAGTTSQVAGAAKGQVAGGADGLAAKAKHFLRHGLEMCAAMCLGLVVGNLLYFWVAWQAGYASPYQQLPELSTVVVTFNMTAPMVAWMRFRGMAWRPIVEMSAAMVVLAVLILGGGWLGILEKGTLARLEHDLMMPAMLIPMLLRLDLYTGKSCH